MTKKRFCIFILFNITQYHQIDHEEYIIYLRILNLVVQPLMSLFQYSNILLNILSFLSTRVI